MTEFCRLVGYFVYINDDSEGEDGTHFLSMQGMHSRDKDALCPPLLAAKGRPDSEDISDCAILDSFSLLLLDLI